MNFESRTTEMIVLLRQLVETESPTNEKEAVDRVGVLLAEASRNLGANVTIHSQELRGDHIISRWGAGEGGILLLGHMDTVFPLGTLAEMPFYEKDGKIFGPGVLDMKSGLVIILTAITMLRDADKMPKYPITALFTSDEEVGSQTSRALIEELAANSDLVLVLEPALSDGSLKTWRKGVGDFEISIKGRAAHAGGAHEDGCNAIEEMAHQILAIQKLTDYEKGTTLNVGLISGGTASNVVPETAEVKVDLRVIQAGEYERIALAIQGLKPVLNGVSIEVTSEFNRPPMPFDATMEETYEKARGIAERAGITLKAGGSGGASDGNFVAPLGIPLLDGLGAVGEGLHSSREYILIKSLPERALLLANLLQNW